MTDTSPIRIGIVAGEVSGDVLAAGLLRELKQRLPDLHIEGVAGPRMRAEGCVQLYSMDELTVMGFEALERAPRILSIRRSLIQRFTQNPPDLFIGVDAPDFNLTLECALRNAGIPTVHYVSPTVWAWRRWRIGKIRRAVDHMLTLFPFEEDFYRREGVAVTFVGHPLADVIPLEQNREAERLKLDLPRDAKIVALLPGSRGSELKRHANLFAQTAAWLHRRYPNLLFVAPFASEETQAVFSRAIERYAPDVPIKSILNHSREAMAAADVVLCASGTATLEAALLGRPMVVTYKISWLSYLLVRPMLHVRLFSLPNNLAGKALVPEYIQGDATVGNLGGALERLLSNPAQADQMSRALKAMHQSLRCNANARAAEAVLTVVARRKTKSTQAVA